MPLTSESYLGLTKRSATKNSRRALVVSPGVAFALTNELAPFTSGYKRIDSHEAAGWHAHVLVVSVVV